MITPQYSTLLYNNIRYTLNHFFSKIQDFLRKRLTDNGFMESLKDRKIAFWKMFSHFLEPNKELLSICEINF